MRDPVEIARDIFLRTLSRIDVERVFRNRVEVRGGLMSFDGAEVDLSAHDDILVVGFGKASLKMGLAAEQLLGDRISRSILVTDRRHRLPLRSEVIVAGHPIPTAESFGAGRRIVEAVRACASRSLIIFLISGGGSALVELPIIPEVTLEDLRKMNQVLINCGATIREINIIRKHLSGIKGGRLASLAGEVRTVVFFISDVNSGDLQSIASNPVVEDDSSLTSFFGVLAKYNLVDILPSRIAKLVESGGIPELPRRGAHALTTCVLMDNAMALAEAHAVAEAQGLRSIVYTDLEEGRYQDVSDELMRRLVHLEDRFPGEPLCIISGGEVSCPARGRGLGGRNQEFVLYSAARLERLAVPRPTGILSCGTDGIDGNSFFAGAVAGNRTLADGGRLGLNAAEYLERNDSFSFFQKVGGGIVTGPTGNNVRDIRILVRGSG